MPTTTSSSDHETGQRTAIIRTKDHAIRVTEHVDGPATCSLIPFNPSRRCTSLDTPKPMTFDEALAYWSAFLQPSVAYRVTAAA